MIKANIWILWVVAVMIISLSTRNPIYLSVLLFGLFYLGHQLAQKKNQSPWLLPNLKFILTMILLSTLINGLFAHIGATVLFTIPQGWPLIGGIITLESLVYGAINGLIIGVLYLLFNVLNLALSIKQITRLIPRAFYPVAMVVTIALTFFPSIQQRTQEIKEAQMIRGNPMKKVADWLPILIPLLVSSLENAIQLAESMTSRGFHKKSMENSSIPLTGLILATFAVFSGWILQLYQYPEFVFITLYFIGFILTVGILLFLGKQSKITRYHQELWHKADIVLGLITTLFLVGFAYLTLSNQLLSINYSPYPSLKPPTIQIIGIVLCLLPIIPGFRVRHD